MRELVPDEAKWHAYFGGKRASLCRALFSITNVSALGISNIAFRTLTLANLIIKISNSARRKGKSELMKWPLEDCLAKVRFNDLEYVFYCPRGYDFFSYMNPYFHEYDVAAFAYAALREGDSFIDVGAHGGMYTLLAGRRVGRDGRVISIEPNPINLKFVRLNISANRLTNVIVVPKAAGDLRGEITLFYSSSDTALTSAYGKVDKSVKANVITLDDTYLKYLEPRSVRMVKIDTEGYDFRVLKGATRMLLRTGYVVVEEHSVEVKRFLKRHGFIVTQMKPSLSLLGTNPSPRVG